MVQDVIIVGEVVAWDDIDSSVFLNLPMLLTKTLTFRQQLILGELFRPVRFCGFLQVTVYSHTGKAKDRSII